METNLEEVISQSEIHRRERISYEFPLDSCVFVSYFISNLSDKRLVEALEKDVDFFNLF